MGRFRVTLWDKDGFICEKVLENATNLRVISELNGENTFSFDLAINDPKYSFLDYRKIIRLEDTAIEVHSTKIINAPATGKSISVLNGANFDIGDFLLVFEKPNLAISKRLTANVSAGSNATLTLDSYSGISEGDYLRIEDENHSEVFKVLTVTGSSITADLAYSYSAGASVTAPARSFVGKIISARKGSTTTVNAESASASAVVIEVNSTQGFAVGDYVWIDDGINSEAADITAISAGVSITVSSLANSYVAGASVTNYSFTLSRRDFLPAANSEVRKVNFTTYQIASFTEKRVDGKPIATINCEHISYRLNDSYFLIDGRGDISYSSKGSGVIKADRVDIDTLLNDLLARHVDSNGNPLDLDKFIKGDLYSFRYSEGTISVTNGSATITGANTEWFAQNISQGSTLSIEGDSTLYTVERVVSDTSLIVTANVQRESGTGLKYLIISKGIQTYSTEKTGTCDVTQGSDKIENVSGNIVDGNVAAGAIFQLEGDAKDYYIEKVELSDTLYLTESVARDTETNVNFTIKRDEREITFSSATTLLGCLNEIAKVWSDDRQAIWYEIDEDKSINICRKPLPDDRDPTSDLAIRYTYDVVKNLRALSRIYDKTEFGNRVLALGARSGWTNAFSGITASVIADDDNSKLQFRVAAGDAKKFRPGDPIQILQSKVDIPAIDSAGQVTITKDTTQYDYSEEFPEIYTDESSAAQNNTADDMTLVRSPPKLFDAYWFGSATKFNEIRLSISTVGAVKGASDWGVTWRYYNGTSWQTLSFLEQEITDFKSVSEPGVYSNKFVPPSDWTVFTGPATGYWIKAEITSRTVGTDNSGVDNKTTSMTDTTQNFAGAEGMIIHNITDGSSGIITSVSTTTNPNDTVNFSGGLSGGTDNDFDNGDEYFIMTQPKGARAWHGKWQENQFQGGLIVITSGEGAGQIRRVISNDEDTITVSRAWDKLPIGANAIVAKNIGNTYIRGFGYNKFRVDSASSTRVDVYDEQLPEYAYRGGILNVLRGTGMSQSFEIRDNEIDDYDGDSSIDDSRIRIRGIFNPIPDTTSIVEVIAPAQMVEEYRSGTYFTTNTVEVVPSDHNYGAWRADMWNNGKLYITSGSDSGSSYTISDTDYNAGTSRWRITISGTFATTPSDGDGILLVKETDLPLSVASGLRFTPAAGDEVVLLLKETGGALIVGKHADYRSTVVSATQTTITVQSGDGGKFEKHQTIFVGARTITSDLLFNIRRGDQAMGQVVTIASKSGDTLTLNEILNPVPQPGDHVEIMAIVSTDGIRRYGGPVELTFDASDINDPKLLYYYADKFLQEAASLSPKYEIDFLHLYELDPKIWKFDNYELGDTMRVIDDELDLDSSSLRIIREEYDPDTPADVKIQVAKLLKSQIRTQSEIVGAKLDHLESTTEDIKRESAAPVCVYWRDEMKLCGRDEPPNTFCDSLESNRDGRLTREKQRITKAQCQAYTPVVDDLALGTDEGAIVTATEVLIPDVDNTDWNDTKRQPVAREYEVTKSSRAFITGVWDATTGSKLEEDDADVRIQIYDTTGEIVPQDEGAWTGCWVQAKLASGFTPPGGSGVHVRAVALTVGKRA